MIGSILRALMKRHYLYKVDLKTQTAFCTVCGFTKIHIPKTRTRTTPKVFCVARAIELREMSQKNYDQQRGEAFATGLEAAPFPIGNQPRNVDCNLRHMRSN